MAAIMSELPILKPPEQLADFDLSLISELDMTFTATKITTAPFTTSHRSSSSSPPLAGVSPLMRLMQDVEFKSPNYIY